MARFVGTSVKVGATTHEFALNANARELLALLLPADDLGTGAFARVATIGGNLSSACHRSGPRLLVGSMFEPE